MKTQWFFFSGYSDYGDVMNNFSRFLDGGFWRIQSDVIVYAFQEAFQEIF